MNTPKKRRLANKVEPILRVSGIIVLTLVLCVSPLSQVTVSAQSPRILASVTHNWFQIENFTPGTTVNLSIFASSAPGAEMVWGDTRLSDSSGFVFVGEWERPIDLVPGNFLVVSDGVIEKQLLLEEVWLDVFDPDMDYLAGRAPAERLVWVGTGNATRGCSMEVSSDLDGNWSADFNLQPCDVTEDMWAAAQVFDGDEDATEANPAPGMGLRVNYGHDWVESFYETGHVVSITVTESDGVTVRATADVISAPRDEWGGETGFQTAPEDWNPAPPDIQPYDWVFAWVDNGVSAQVQLGDIQGEVFVFSDSIAGTIEAPWLTDPVPVECLDWGSGAGPFNKDAGTIFTDGLDPYACSWDPGREWDLQAWQDVGVGYFTPEGHWVANALHAEHWMAFWTVDLPPGFWPAGEYSYYYEFAYTEPEPGAMTGDPLPMVVSGTSGDAETPIYHTYVLIQPWIWMPQQAWTGSSCEPVGVVHPEQPTRVVWGWVNDFSMSYDEALAHFNSFSVEVFWEGAANGSAELTMGELMPFTGRDARFELVCSLTDHPQPFWRDDFDGEIMDPWYWVNENPSRWNLDENPGFLRIYASHQGAGGENLLLRPVAEGDFTIKTHLIFEPQTNFQAAGLILYQDQENLLAIWRAFCDLPEACVGNGIYFDKVIGGNFTDGNFSTVVDSPSEAYLRLEKRGEMVRAFFSADGISWIEIGTHWIPPEFQVNGVGLAAVGDNDTSDPDIPADFDFFELTEGWGFLPEGFHDYDEGDVPNWACNAGGWAVDPDDPNADVNVRILADGEVVVTDLKAENYRPDLETSWIEGGGGCPGGTCAFEVSLWDLISPYEIHEITVEAQDLSSGEWRPLYATPRPLTCRTYDIYVYDTLTRETKHITNLRDSYEFNPRWSPNGKKIVHDRWDLDFGTHEIQITVVGSGQSTPLPGAENGSYPAWSPNGQWIVFDRDLGEGPNLYLLPPIGGEPTLVTQDAMMASWAPNSRRVVFHRPSDGSLRTVDLSTGQETLVVERGNGPAWSPNGRWIAYEVDGNLWKVEVNLFGIPQSPPIQLTDLPTWEGRPSWSPDSKTIIFHAGFDRDTDIWMVPAGGGDPSWLTGAPGFADYDPNFSQNGRYVSYASFSPEGQAARLWVAAYTYDLPAGSLSAGSYPYHFEFEWDVPDPGSFSGQGGELIVSNEAPLYEGCVLLRGPSVLRGLDTPDGLVCEEISEINPAQPARFLIGWLNESEMTYPEAVAYFESLAGKVVWGEGMEATLTGHDIRPFSFADLDAWFRYVCSYSRQPAPGLLAYTFGLKLYISLAVNGSQ